MEKFVYFSLVGCAHFWRRFYNLFLNKWCLFGVCSALRKLCIFLTWFNFKWWTKCVLHTKKSTFWMCSMLKGLTLDVVLHINKLCEFWPLSSYGQMPKIKLKRWQNTIITNNHFKSADILKIFKHIFNHSIQEG